MFVKNLQNGIRVLDNAILPVMSRVRQFKQRLQHIQKH